MNVVRETFIENRLAFSNGNLRIGVKEDPEIIQHVSKPSNKEHRVARRRELHEEIDWLRSS